MATVSGFESLVHPSRSDLRQFHELFLPTYLASSGEARRQAVAAVSQWPVVPEATAFFIAREPIEIAAIFLTRSAALSERQLISMLRHASPAHARAIERRDDLSPQMIESLVDLHRQHRARGLAAAGAPAARDTIATDDGAAPLPGAAIAQQGPGENGPAGEGLMEQRPAEQRTDEPSQDAAAGHALTEARRLAREEELRDEIKALVRTQMPKPAGLPPLAAIGEAHMALLARFARAGENGMFCVVLADALGASHWLSERILLDVSGMQLATTLRALDAPQVDGTYVLARLYPQLARAGDGGSRAERLLSGLRRTTCVERVESWRRADAYTHAGASADAPAATPAAAANSSADETRENERYGTLTRLAARR